jgi:asparagine synthase (glutamine-hydrolysing)
VSEAPAGRLEDGRLTIAGAAAGADGLIVAGAPVALVEPAWRRWGEDLAAHVDATFAVWDEGWGGGVGARARGGATPVLFAEEPGALAFAGDPGPLLELLRTRPAPDPAGIGAWLARGTAPVGGTLLAGVHRLLPGEHLRIGAGAVRRGRHHRPAFAEPIRERDEAVAALREALERAVGRAAGPRVALLLSGGLDSTTVAALSPQPRPLALHAAFPHDPEVDETAAVDATVAALSLNGIRAAVADGRPLAAAAAHSARWHAPLPSPTEPIWAALVARAAQEGAEVVLDGEGGDSVLGPAPFILADLLGRGRLRAARAAAADLVGADLAARALWRYGAIGLLPAGVHEAWRRRRGARRYAADWMRPQVAEALFEADRRWDWKRLDGPRWWAERAHGLVDGLDASGAHDLPRRRAAEAGLQSRHPLQDQQLIDVALRLEPTLLHDADRDRPLARDALAGIVPDHVRRPATKPAFNTLQERWLVAEQPTAERLLGPDALVAEYVDIDAVRAWILGDPARHPAGRTRWPLDAWRVLSLEVWLREHAGRNEAHAESDFEQVSLDFGVIP